LVGKGFQLVIEMVGMQKSGEKNCILLHDNCVVKDFEEEKGETLTA
jgi:hypothetical protein